jgi:glycosyltransferase involved in cell wall biosynthesis
MAHWPSPFVTPLHAAVSEQIIRTACNEAKPVILLTYGENQYSAQLASAGADLRKKLVVFLHQPPSWHRLFWQDISVFDNIGAIICLSKELAHYMASITKSPVFNIRHGVDLDFFQPYDKNTSTLPYKLLFVGQWLRDFETLEKAFTIIQAQHPTIKLDCVVPFNKREALPLMRLARFSNVRWHAQISSHDLRLLYQKASLLLLPLIDATANNAVVEALACGLPVITSDVGGIEEYIDHHSGELCPAGNAEAHAQATLRWLGAKERRERAALTTRLFAEDHLCWKDIASEVLMHLNCIEK